MIFFRGRRFISNSSSGWPRILVSIDKDGNISRPMVSNFIKVEVMAKKALGVLAVGGGPVLLASGPSLGVG